MKIFQIAMVLTLIGCGSADSVPTATVSGKVTLDGEPLKEGKIIFTPQATDENNVEPGKMTEAQITNGEYSLSSSAGAAVGTNKVSITAFRVTGKEMSDGEEIEKKEQYIPARYNSETTLSIDVTSGGNKKDFELTSE